MEKEYFKNGHDWYSEKYLSSQVQAKRWMLAFVAQATLSLSLGVCIALMLPLKTMVPFPILVNENNQLVKALHPKSDYLPINEAMVQNDIVRYIRNREGYNAHTLNYQYRQVAHSTAGNIFADFEKAQSPQNPASPVNLLGMEGARDIKVLAVIFLDNNEAETNHRYKALASNVVQVDYSSVTKTSGENKSEHWVATISFEYQGIQKDEVLAWENWNGFVVTSYRVHPRLT